MNKYSKQSEREGGKRGRALLGRAWGVGACEQSERPPLNKKKILILGAGFAGLRAALDLAKQQNKIPNYEIILVDKRDVHIYTPDLYEIATAFIPKITEECLSQLKETVAIKIRTLIRGKPITFLQDKAIKWDPAKKIITLSKYGKLSYDYLVLTLGSVSDYYNIPGLEQFSYPLKTVKHAIGIQCDLDHYFQYLWKENRKKAVNLVIGGGGATGVEFGGELPRYVDKLCQKYQYPRKKVHITLIQATNELVGVGPQFSRRIQERLEKAGVAVKLNTSITSAYAGEISVKNFSSLSPSKKVSKETKLFCDMLIWAGGVKPHPFLLQQKLKAEKTGAIKVDETLRAKDFKNVFAAGDMAHFIDPKTKKTAPLLAQVAFAQGKILANNILATIQGGPFLPYRLKIKGVIIPVAGKYAIFKTGTGRCVYGGFIFWILRRLIDLYYAMSIMPPLKAFTKWWHATNIFVKND